MRILITGGAGFIGAHLARRLAKNPGNSIIVLDNLRRSRREAVADIVPAVDFVEGDIRDAADVRSAMAGVNLVYHLAAQSSVMNADANEDYTLATNVEGTKNMLRESAAAGVSRFVFTSSREVYGDPDELPVPETAEIAPKNLYGRSKFAGEALCLQMQENGLDIVIFRLANVYGPGDRERVLPLFVDAALEGRPLRLFGGQQVIDFVWIGTVVEALLRASTITLPRTKTGGDFYGECTVKPTPNTVNLNSPSNTVKSPLNTANLTVNIGSGTGTTVAELARRVVEASGSKSKIEVAPARGIEVTRFVADVSKARQIFGIEPPSDPLYKLEEMVEAARHAKGTVSSVHCTDDLRIAKSVVGDREDCPLCQKVAREVTV